MGFSQSANGDGCPTCGRVECRKCFTSVGQILGATGDLLPAALAHIDSIIQAFKHLEVKASRQDDALALRIAEQGKVSARTLLRNATGLDNLLKVLAVGAAMAFAFLAGQSVGAVRGSYQEYLNVQEACAVKE